MMSNIPASSTPGPLVYENFELEIEHLKGKSYDVSVIHSPGGEAHNTMDFPYNKQELDNILLKLQNALLLSSGAYRLAPSAETQTLQKFGRDLYEALLAGDVRTCYEVSCDSALREGKGLRLVLRITPPELAALPWEFMYDQRQKEFIGLSRDKPIVRYMETPQPIQPLTIKPPLRILGMVANPSELPRLDINAEKQRIENAVKDLQERGLLSLTWVNGQTWRDLHNVMMDESWHIFHFIGHGSFDITADEGMIDLADENLHTYPLHASDLATLLSDNHSLRLVLLSSCEGGRGSDKDIFSSMAAVLVGRGIPAVLAMQFAITDQAAIEFSRTFYTALAKFMPVDAAVTEGRKAVSLAVPHSGEWGVPVLYMRASQGILFAQDTSVNLEAERKRRAAEEDERRRLAEEEAVRMRLAAEEAQRKRLAEEYALALSLFKAGQWQQVIEVMNRIKTLDPGYPDPENLTSRSKEKLSGFILPPGLVLAGKVGVIILLIVLVGFFISETFLSHSIIMGTPTPHKVLPAVVVKPISTLTPTVIPSVTPSLHPTLKALPSPDKFILDYFNLIEQRKYAAAFSLLSHNFISEGNIEMNGFKNNWDHYQQINPTVKILEQDDYHAKVLVALDLIWNSGEQSQTQLYYDLIPDPDRNNWLFNHGYY
jgi:hypothetical protein